AVEPPHEPVAVRRMEARQELATVASKRLLWTPMAERGPDLVQISAKGRGIDRDLLVAARPQHPLAQMLPQHVQRIAKRRPGVRGVELRPERRQQQVPPVPGSRSRRGKIGEER